MADLSGLSDEALAAAALAAHHRRATGQKILSVVRKDGAGHRASAAAADELDGRGLVRAEEREIVFTPAGEEALERVVAAIRDRQRSA